MSSQRASGILLHPTSFPSRYGIGDLGRSAYDFIDFLEGSGQKLWQILPLGPTGFEHSPYIMNFSTFAGNPLMICLEKLAEEGWLDGAELTPLAGEDIVADRVNFDRVIPHKTQYLKKAFENFQKALAANPNPEFEKFCREQAWWLDDYTLFAALLDAHPGTTWNQWEPEIARRQPEALKAKAEELKDSVLYQQFLQFEFFEQWSKLRAYANGKGIQIIGDVSIYVCHNSSDVWANPAMFKLDPDTLEPAYIAGVPPDYFSATGQLWGNPVYDWDKHKETGYSWWVDRFRATLLYVDLVRIDHFRGFEAYWEVPGTEETAMNGEWIPGPNDEFFETLKAKLGSLPVLAEDLGIITPEVEALRDRFEFPGMKILLFAFGDDANNPYLPHNYIQNCIVYTGTHDNDTTLGWWKSAPPELKQRVADYLGYDSPDEIAEINWSLIRLALSSIADRAIIPLQDLLGLDNRGRMNDPSINAGNWRWRYESSDLLTPQLRDRLLKMTQLYGR
ncbi:MAG TPA: 4-alpha-glucanotransferase [Oscillatoriales cyanobacterium M59_W2019_021]|nr:MAG: 4-alpha-glucanotransferase [Cyanobacteria bacterium J055]HIK33764.1 4-alpha-glucanotransferase [Oscillatoriales cyanobacterium M4454_W2019_049]HIK53105.1 4-alpha-glucanotransferase [Oscillatoriales cyanobacterium M59_W2019_021]